MEAGTEEEKECLQSSQVRPHAGHGLEKLTQDGHHKHACTHENQSPALKLGGPTVSTVPSVDEDLPVPDLGGPATPTGPSVNEDLPALELGGPMASTDPSVDEDLPVPDLGGPAMPTGPSVNEDLLATELGGPMPSTDPSVDKDLPAPGLDRMVAPTNVRHEQRTRPIIDLEALMESAILSPMRQSMEFILALKNASLDDNVAKLSTDALERLQNPPDEVVTIDNPGICFAISTYLALENASQQAYNRVCEAVS
ncbi:hypothetical protein BKA82DRAFT_4360024 [Pisolithus tinctorius]|nr:hypothetical protein BKA82DRAFT_4360024 [Pisolithus tinctorius]